MHSQLSLAVVVAVACADTFVHQVAAVRLFVAFNLHKRLFASSNNIVCMCYSLYVTFSWCFIWWQQLIQQLFHLLFLLMLIKCLTTIVRELQACLLLLLLISPPARASTTWELQANWPYIYYSWISAVLVYVLFCCFFWLVPTSRQMEAYKLLISTSCRATPMGNIRENTTNWHYFCLWKN